MWESVESRRGVPSRRVWCQGVWGCNLLSCCVGECLIHSKLRRVKKNVMFVYNIDITKCCTTNRFVC